MNVKVINIKSDYEPLLAFLFPEYSISDSMACTSKFITHFTVTSKLDRELLDHRYSDCIIISSQIFDELWDLSKITDEVVKFGRQRLKLRKTKFIPNDNTLLADALNFLYGNSIDETDTNIIELFDSFGSASFTSKFQKLSQSVPVQPLISAVVTFLTKVLSDNGSLYYKKKALLYKTKINTNLVNASTLYAQSLKDPHGLAFCKFVNDLIL